MFRLLPRNTTLRMRVTLCCAALGGITGVFMAYVADRISDRDERQLVNEEMHAEMDIQILMHGSDLSDANLPRSLWKSVYIDRPGQPPTSPDYARSLPKGVTELDERLDGKGDRFAVVRDTPKGRVTMVITLPNSPARQRRFTDELIAMVLLGILLGAWLGRLLAGSMLSPVLRLYDQVDRTDPTTELRDIAEDHHDDEVGALANAFIRYHARMQQAIEREMMFSADASHELRTPLTVLQGALDLLRDSQASNLPGRRRVERIRRSAAEIGGLLDALLLIARSVETQEPPVKVDVDAALASVIAEFHDELDAAHITLGLRCQPSTQVLALPGLLRVALRLLFRAIASGAWGQDLRLDADASGLVLAQAKAVASDAPVPVFEPAMAEAVANLASSAAPPRTEPAPSPSVPNPAVQGAQMVHAGSTAPRRSDEIGGVGMLRRLCERYGWKLEVADEAEQPIALRLRFGPAATPADGVDTETSS